MPIKEDIYCDFYIPKGKVYVEFWGLEDDEAYIKRKEQKIGLYKKYNLNLIETDNDKIGNLDDHLSKGLFKFLCEFKFVEKRGERPCDYFKVWMYSATAFASSSLIGVAIGFIIAPRPNLFAPVL